MRLPPPDESSERPGRSRLPVRPQPARLRQRRPRKHTGRVPLDSNPNWDPRALNQLSGGDADGDGLPIPCDPATEESGAQCGNALDDDGDGRVNDGCPASEFLETGAQCENAVDDDSDGLVNDGCPAIGFDNDQDDDGWQNRIDSCPTIADAAPGGGAGITPNTFMWDLDVPGLVAPDGGPPTETSRLLVTSRERVASGARSSRRPAPTATTTPRRPRKRSASAQLLLTATVRLTATSMAWSTLATHASGERTRRSRSLTCSARRH